MLVQIEITANVNSYVGDRRASARYASFDYCYNHFQSARERGELEALADGEGLTTACLQLGFYLASWGMMRGSSQLLQRSIRELIPVIRTIVAEPPATWALSVRDIDNYSREALALHRRIKSAFTFDASDILITKTILGVFGSVPAFDRYFCAGFGCSTMSRKSLHRVAQFYEANQATIDAINVATLDVVSGSSTARRYPAGKIVDMVFFVEGLKVRGR